MKLKVRIVQCYFKFSERNLVIEPVLKMCSFEPCLYNTIRTSWPPKGKHILGTFDENNIILYQAYKPSIADFAVTNQTFLNCPDYSTTRMTWLKPNFLWMMFRSGWATKSNQTRILAITITRAGFEEILRSSSNVRLQWDPDHDPHGERVYRRAIQLGIKGRVLDKFLKEWIVKIEDVTEFVHEQGEKVRRKVSDLDSLLVPKERVYELMDKELAEKIGLDAWPSKDVQVHQ